MQHLIYCVEHVGYLDALFAGKAARERAVSLKCLANILYFAFDVFKPMKATGGLPLSSFKLEKFFKFLFIAYNKEYGEMFFFIRSNIFDYFELCIPQNMQCKC